MEPAEILEKAADALESGTLPWARYGDAATFAQCMDNSTYCAIEAMSWATRGDKGAVIIEGRWSYSRAVKAASDEASRRLGRATHITYWNDMHAKDVHEVVDVMKHAAKDLRNQSIDKESSI